MTFTSRFFTVEEMRCPCCYKCDMDHDFMLELSDLRKELLVPLHINSGYRCRAHNASLAPHSSPRSLHLVGKAADIRWPVDRFSMLYYALRHFDGIGIGKSYLHVDKGGIKKVWIY